MGRGPATDLSVVVGPTVYDEEKFDRAAGRFEAEIQAASPLKTGSP